MTIIVVKNGTHFINIECAGLTYLEYCGDDDIYRCEYSAWAFGLFAILGVVAILVPVVLIINCGVRWYHRKEAENFRPNISRTTSYSSLYPHEVMRNDDDDDDDDEVILLNSTIYTLKEEIFADFQAQFRKFQNSREKKFLNLRN